MNGTDEYKSVWLSLVMTEKTRRHKSSEFQFEFLKHYRFWFVFLGVPNFQPLTCDSKVSLFSWRKRRKMNCLIRYPCDSEKYEKNNLTYHSWITPCGVIKQNCMEYWYEPAESSFRTKREKKTGIIHKQSLKRDDTRNLTFCDYYWFCRKFCFGSKIRRNGQESLFWESLYLAQRRHLYAESAGSDPENSDSGGRETCQLYGFLLFCYRNWTNNTKINRKKGRVEAPPRPSSKSARGTDGALQSCHPGGYSTASTISCMYTLNLESRLNFFSVPCSPVFPV